MKLLLFILLTFSFYNFILGQSPLSQEEGWPTDFVFTDNSNIRSAPSISSHIIGNLPQNTTIDYNQDLPWRLDTVNGIENYWKPIKYHNTSGYIWSVILAISAFKTSANSKQTVLVHFSSKKELSFKIFDQNILKYKTSFLKTKEGIISSTSIGKIENSNHKEIWVVKYKDKSYELYSWDGSSIRLFDKKLKDDSFITNTYKKYKYCIVSANAVNLRTQPNIQAKALTSLPINSTVTLIKNGPRVKLDNIWGTWAKVKWKDKTGYIWSNNLSIPIYYIKSNKHKNESFLYTTKGLYALKENKIVDFISIPFWYDEGFYNKGSQGLQDNFQFLTFVMQATSCGQSSGEVYYLWNGKKLKHFGSDYGIGDGGFSEFYTLIFPNENGGIKNRVIQYNEIGESVNYFPTANSNEDYSYLIFSHSTKIMKYNGDTLIEMPSKYTRLNNSIRQVNSKFNLYRYEFGDLNLDGIEDVICIVSESTIYDYEPTSKPTVLIAMGDTQQNYTIIESNNKFLENSYAYNIEIKNSNFTITSKPPYNFGYDEENKVSQFNFYYNKTDKKTYWKSKTEAICTNKQWKTNTYQFKTKKILFSEAWSKSLSPEENEY